MYVGIWLYYRDTNLVGHLILKPSKYLAAISLTHGTKAHLSAKCSLLTLGKMLIVWFALSSPARSEEPSVLGEPVPPPPLADQKAAIHPLDPQFGAKRAGPAFKLELAPPSDEQLKNAKAGLSLNPMRIGFGRQPPDVVGVSSLAAHPAWTKTQDLDWTLWVEIKSPKAAAIRLSVIVDLLPKGGELRFYDATGRLMLVRDSSSLRGDEGKEIDSSKNKAPAEEIWSPVVSGDTAFFEVFLPSATNLSELKARLGLISHLTDLPLTSKQIENATKLSASCNLDAVCYSSFENIRKSVARMVYTSNGSTFLCTGTALNDIESTTFRPYFLSANHCLSTQSEANSLNTFWNYESSTCNGNSLSSSIRQLTQGAELLTTDYDTDTSLFILREQLPAGLWFSGWKASTFELGSVVGVHHPRGDLKKISFGSAVSYSSRFTEDSLSSGDGSANFLRTVWSSGITEGGSSGSAIFNSQQQIVGTLLGGASSCSQPTAPDWYGRFDRAYFEGEWRYFLFSSSALDGIRDALDDNAQQINFTFSNSTFPWVIAFDASVSGGTSVSNSNVENNESSALSATLSGPGQLSFDWKVSSEQGYDFLSVSLDGNQLARISGEVDWSAFDPIDLPAGSHTVTWTFSKDFSVSRGKDRGWIDNLAFQTSDRDGDGVPDDEDAFPDDPNESIDNDGDGLGANLEASLGTSDSNIDSDGDGFTDREEYESESNPLNAEDIPALSNGLPIWLLYEATKGT